MLNFTINTAACISCGECVADCPARIIAMEGGVSVISPENEVGCYRCQHCLAVCPTGAVSILGLQPSASLPLNGVLPDADAMEYLLRSRRSVRRYRQENLEPGVMDRLLDVAWQAPTGRNTRNVLFTVVDDREKLAQLRDRILQGLGRLVRENRLPDEFGYFADFVTLWEEKQIDVLFRGAPHLLITSAPQQAVSPVPNCMIALSYFELFARSMEIGTLWNGLARLAINDLLPEIRQSLNIPGDHVIGYVMSFGKPAVRYHRTVQLGPAQIRRV